MTALVQMLSCACQALVHTPSIAQHSNTDSVVSSTSTTPSQARRLT